MASIDRHLGRVRDWILLGYMLPAGQLVFWLATVPVVRDVLAGWYESGAPATLGASALWLVLPFLVLCFDIAVMHHGRWWTSSLRQVAIFLAAVGIAALLLGLALGAVVGRSASSGVANGPYQFPIVPPWHELPFYALLRAVPSKAGGVALMFASMLLPMVWPWMRADELRRGRTRRVWPLFCLALAVAWIGLGYLGSRSPGDVTVPATLALALFYFAFFLLLPPVLGRFAGGAAT